MPLTYIFPSAATILATFRNNKPSKLPLPKKTPRIAFGLAA